ncbi:threonine aldolase family protein [Phenylobacterium sp.]|jgi:threonine aldolase|uniref:threonine aldolase family protein n=1 Tax=Phenylobacterium sp. TaxID=1871053 RepID=UPI002E2FEC7D|nr:beta-eliminating lyase-related protein [Phenylobacterium sp.]HEX3367255.1 beta-eliminating lyase-related protein [Phenylobacterium sp.]
MAALAAANVGYAPAYGADPVTARAGDLVRELLDADAEVRFVASGTAANALALATLCRPFEAVLAHHHAHILVEEAGAPTFFGGGLALVGLPGEAGRVDPAALEAALALPETASRQSPAALSLTNTTEYGALYSAGAIVRLTASARASGLATHLDGARIANAAAAGLDLTHIAKLGIDILVIGGTKAGMPPTEAVVIFDRKLANRFDTRLKQCGQLPAKARFLAAPFIGMLETGAFLRHAAHANAMARRLAAAQPFPLRHPVDANGVFLQIDGPSLRRLNDAGWFAKRVHDGSVRFMCSWATTPATVDQLCEDLSAAVR